MSLVDDLKKYGVTGMVDLGCQIRDDNLCWVTRIHQAGREYTIAVPHTVDASLRAVFDTVVVQTIWNMEGKRWQTQLNTYTTS